MDEAGKDVLKDLYQAMITKLDGIDRFISPDEMAEKEKDENGNPVLKYNVESTRDANFIFACINRFLDEMWKQLGSYPLQYLYKAPYTKLQETAVESSWGDSGSDEYGKYFAIYLILKSINRALTARESQIQALTKEKEAIEEQNAATPAELDLYVYFKENYPDNAKQFMMRLSAFMREDEYVDDNFV